MILRGKVLQSSPRAIGEEMDTSENETHGPRREEEIQAGQNEGDPRLKSGEEISGPSLGRSVSRHKNFTEALEEIDLALAEFDSANATILQPKAEVSTISQTGDPDKDLVVGEGVHFTHAGDNHRVSTDLKSNTSLGGQF